MACKDVLTFFSFILLWPLKKEVQVTYMTIKQDENQPCTSECTESADSVKNRHGELSEKPAQVNREIHKSRPNKALHLNVPLMPLADALHKPNLWQYVFSQELIQVVAKCSNLDNPIRAV